MRLNGKLAIVTGGSRGIGFATVKAFLREGASVVLCASTQASADKAVALLREQFPGATVEGIAPDLKDLAAVKAAFDGVVQRHGAIHVLVNNAGISESTPFANYTEDLFDKVMGLNVKGLFCCTKAAVDHMLEQGSGVVLNTSSMVGRDGSPAGVAYPTSKFAVNGLTLSLARELGPKGIRVNAVAPGITETDMMRAVPTEVIDPLIAQIPLKRLGTPEDIANAFVFLASDEASYITGAVLPVDGLGRS